MLRQRPCLLLVAVINSLLLGLCLSSSAAASEMDDTFSSSAPDVVKTPREPSADNPNRPSDAENAWAARPYALEANLGVATPVGCAGLMLDAALSPGFSFSFGAGTNGEGLQLAGMLRVRFAMKEQRAWYFGVGGSTGPHYQSDSTQMTILAPLAGMAESPYPSAYTWQRANWMNVEAGWEMRRWTGFVMRPYAGLAFLTNIKAGEPSQPPGEDPWQHRRLDPVGVLFYTGIALGYAL